MIALRLSEPKVCITTVKSIARSWEARLPVSRRLFKSTSGHRYPRPLLTKAEHHAHCKLIYTAISDKNESNVTALYLRLHDSARVRQIQLSCRT